MRCLIVQGPLLYQGPRSSIHSLPSSLKPWFSSHHPLILSTCFQLAFSIFQKKKKKPHPSILFSASLHYSFCTSYSSIHNLLPNPLLFQTSYCQFLWTYINHPSHTLLYLGVDHSPFLKHFSRCSCSLLSWRFINSLHLSLELQTTCR